MSFSAEKITRALYLLPVLLHIPSDFFLCPVSPRWCIEKFPSRLVKNSMHARVFSMKPLLVAGNPCWILLPSPLPLSRVEQWYSNKPWCLASLAGNKRRKSNCICENPRVSTYRLHMFSSCAAEKFLSVFLNTLFTFTIFHMFLFLSFKFSSRCVCARR